MMNIEITLFHLVCIFLIMIGCLWIGNLLGKWTGGQR